MLALSASLVLAFVGPPPPAATQASSSGLSVRLQPLIKAHRGQVAIGVKHLRTGESYFFNGDQVMPTASLIKVAIMVETYLQADEGKISLRDKIALKKEDMVPGSGVLSYHFSEGLELPLRDCVRLMIALSDNSATNLVLERVGIANVNKRMKSWGLPETRINAKVFRGSTTSVDKARTNKYGLGSTTTKEMVKLFEKIQTNDGIRPGLKLAMLEHLKKNEDKFKFGRLLPPGVTVAHKDGSVSNARTDAGVLFTPSGPIVLCVLTNNNVDRRWVSENAGNMLCARVARAVCDHYHAKK
jgi:beta-lactamase class A